MKRIGLLFGLSVLVTVVFYGALPGETYPEFVTDSFVRCVKYVLAVGWLTLLFFVLSHIPRIVGIPFLIVFFLPSAFAVYLARFIGMKATTDVFMNIAETNSVEASAFVSIWAVCAILLYVACMSALGCLLKKLQFKIRHPLITLSGIAILLAATTVMSVAGMTGNPPVVFPAFCFRPIASVFDVFDVMEKIDRLNDEEIRVAKVFSESEKNALPIVFFHIGESVRADHASFNGYRRMTMPCVQREFDAGNVLSFQKCVSFSIQTRWSLLGICTPSTVLDPVFRHGSFIPYLNAYGIHTSGFFSSMCDGSEKRHATLMKITRTLQDKIFTAEYADSLHETVTTTLSKIKGGDFFLYYGEGAHMPGSSYNHEKYSVFLPDDFALKPLDAEIRNNAYDNCLVATDAFIGNAIDALRDKNAVYVYVADHGDMLGEDGRWGRDVRNFRRPETRHVLAFVWASEKFQKENPKQWQQLKANHKRIKIISHDVFYHSVLSLFGIKNDFYDPSCDLFAPEAKDFPTKMPEAESLNLPDSFVFSKE